MRLYLDTEFSEDGWTIDLISIALVSETGQEFYRQNASADLRAANQWVRDNVIPRLWPCPQNIPGPRHIYGPCVDPTCVWRPRRKIADELLRWVLQQCTERASPGLEFWGYYADYDWVALCQLFGRMVDLPSGWPMYCRDLKQLADDLGNPLLPAEGKNEHNALSDARWNRLAHEFLMQHERSTRQDAGWEEDQASRLREAAAVFRGGARPSPEGPADPDGHLGGGATGQGGRDQEQAVRAAVRDGQETEVTDAGIC